MQINVNHRKIRCGWVCLLFFLLAIEPVWVNAQSFELKENKKRATLPFRVVRNMVIVKLNINGKGPFNFVLDTGVGLMVITDPKLIDSINLNTKHSIKIYGVNGESYDAYVTPDLAIDMPGVAGEHISAAILKEDHFSMSNYAGMPIHGLLGYEFFSNLAVRFNFYDSTLVVSKPQFVRLLRKGIKIPLSIEDRKPYITTNVKMTNGKELSRKLLIDLGAGHPLSLENMVNEEWLPQNFIAANLGMGLTGPVTGFISRVNEIELGKYRLKDVLTSFPDKDLSSYVPIVPRDGNLGIGILKRFTIIIDYTNEALYIKKGPRFSEPFEHDMTGMEYYYDGQDYGQLIVARVEPGSAADNIGIEKNDQITSINFRAVYKMTIEEIDNLFRLRNGRSVLLEIYRNKQYFRTVLTLKKRI